MNKDTVIKVENVTKQYRLGEFGTGSIAQDLNRLYARIRGKEDPHSIVCTKYENKKQQKDSIWALDGISLEIKRGEIVGIIGGNGAGKSTLLKLISNITAPTSGVISIKGRIASLLEIGTGMHPEMTARENIFLNGCILGMKKKEITRKFDKIIEFAGCEQFVDTPLKRFSSGMQVRLGFSVAAFLEPEILIVDEVLAVGDKQFQQRAIGKIREVTDASNRTVIIVSHNLETIQNICSRGILIEQGKKVVDADANTAIKTYLSGLSGTVNSNLQGNTVRKGLGDIRITDINVENYDNSQLKIIPVGSRVRFRIAYECQKTVSGLQAIISIRDQLNTCIARFDSDVCSDNHMDKLSGTGEIECITDSINLKPGEYFLSVSLLANGRIQDQIFNPVQFEIYPSDYFGSGNLFDPSVELKVYIKHNWKVLTHDY